MILNNLHRVSNMIAATVLFLAPLTCWGNIAEAEAMYEKGEYFAAFRAYVPLAKAGDPVAQAALGRIYLGGQGAPTDTRNAASWYEKAAAKGHAGAQFQLANMLGSGVGVPADAVRAAVLMEKSAEQGVVWAMVSLGVMYRDGSGVTKDIVVAHKWLELAATSAESPVTAQTIGLAKAGLAQLTPSMSPEQLAAAKKSASEWRAVRRTRDTNWQKLINRPVSLQATNEATGDKADRPKVPNQSPAESSPLTRDFFPKS